MKLLFLKNNLPFSLLIRGVTSCHWSHSAVAFGDVVIEARFSGVKKITLDEFKARGEWYAIDVELPDEEKAYEFALAQVGKSYDFTGILGFWFNRDIDDDKKWYCSELSNSIVKTGGICLTRGGLRGISPRDLWVLPLDNKVTSQEKGGIVSWLTKN